MTDEILKEAGGQALSFTGLPLILNTFPSMVTSRNPTLSSIFSPFA